ncbi:hypothetical protein VP01_1458g1 [Puccinia sorghi]|uniref:Uncharacterized protein n=1 Tax=Puccinia sorghi TaxID=27349 RepID=A0A0L6VJW3_9BASI|nr:hypothetical protein VP01_1458g1 [Puccinia sorghi]
MLRFSEPKKASFYILEVPPGSYLKVLVSSIGVVQFILFPHDIMLHCIVNYNMCLPSLNRMNWDELFTYYCNLTVYFSASFLTRFELCTNLACTYISYYRYIILTIYLCTRRSRNLGRYRLFFSLLDTLEYLSKTDKVAASLTQTTLVGEGSMMRQIWSKQWMEDGYMIWVMVQILFCLWGDLGDDGVRCPLKTMTCFYENSFPLDILTISLVNPMCDKGYPGGSHISTKPCSTLSKMGRRPVLCKTFFHSRSREWRSENKPGGKYWQMTMVSMIGDEARCTRIRLIIKQSNREIKVRAIRQKFVGYTVPRIMFSTKNIYNSKVSSLVNKIHCTVKETCSTACITVQTVQ